MLLRSGVRRADIRVRANRFTHHRRSHIAGDRRFAAVVVSTTALTGAWPGAVRAGGRDGGGAGGGGAAAGSAALPVLAVYWCASVGATWTLELRAVGPGSDHRALSGPVQDWVSSGVPTELPAPEDDTVDILAERALQLFPDAEPIRPQPRTRNRRLVGYATGDRDVTQLALWVAEILDGTDPDAPDRDDPDGAGRTHPMPLAARWIAAGFPVRAAADWVSAGVFSPDVARALTGAEPRGRVPASWGRAG